MKLLLTIRTANRAPKNNYVRATVDSLLRGGVEQADIHLVATDQNLAWLLHELDGLPDVKYYAPSRRNTANANGIAQVDVLDRHDADWIVMSEDDLEWCKDPIGSMARWLEDHAAPQQMIYRFFTFGKTVDVSGNVVASPLREMRGSQVVAMRAKDARRFAAWARAHVLDWRPKNAPFQDRPHDGFDKLLGYWALQDRPHVTHGLVSRPFFVRHLGVQSSLHSHGVRMDKEWGGADWSYQRKVAA
jgi:hypothetical protein